MYRSTFSRPRHKLEVNGQLHVAVALTQGKEPPYKLVRGLGGPRTGLDDVEKKNCCPYRDSNSDPSVVQSVASLYIDCDIQALVYSIGVYVYCHLSA
jgi:hypothetical protein